MIVKNQQDVTAAYYGIRCTCTFKHINKKMKRIKGREKKKNNKAEVEEEDVVTMYVLRTPKLNFSSKT